VQSSSAHNYQNGIQFKQDNEKDGAYKSGMILDSRLYNRAVWSGQEHMAGCHSGGQRRVRLVYAVKSCQIYHARPR